MESSAKWAPDTQPCLPRSLLLASCFFTYSCRLSSVVCPPWRVLFGATASSSCPAPGRRQRVLFGALSLLNLPAPGRRQREKKATQAYTIFFASHFCLFTFAFLLAPFSLAVSKMFPCNTKNLAITIPYRWKQPASEPRCFHLFPWPMKNEYRTAVTLPFPHGNTQSSVSMMFRRCFHGLEKD